MSSGGEDGSGTSTSTLIGVAICASGNIAISLALNIQKLAHIRLSAQSSQSSQTQPPPNERSSLLSAPRPLISTSVSDPQLANTPGHPQHVLIPFPNQTPLKAKRSSSKIGASSKRRSGSSKSSPRVDQEYLKSRLWWAGLLTLAVGELGNFTAYAFSPASLVAPLGTVALVANAFWAPIILREPFRKRDLVGISLTVLGGVTVVFASKSSDKKLYPHELLQAIQAPFFIGYTVACVALASGLAALSDTKWGEKYVMVDIGLCAFAGGFTVLATKAFSSFLSLLFLDTFKQLITYPILAVLISTAVLQTIYINKALQRHESRVVIPAQFCSFSLSAIVGSAILYRDFDQVGLPEFLNFAFGGQSAPHLISISNPTNSSDSKTTVALSAFGVYLLTFSSSDPSAQPNNSSPTTPPLTPPPLLRTRLTAPSNDPSLSLRARTLSMTLGGGQYLLAQSSPGSWRDVGSYREGAGREGGRGLIRWMEGESAGSSGVDGEGEGEGDEEEGGEDEREERESDGLVT